MPVLSRERAHHLRKLSSFMSEMQVTLRAFVGYKEETVQGEKVHLQDLTDTILCLPLLIHKGHHEGT